MAGCCPATTFLTQSSPWHLEKLSRQRLVKIYKQWFLACKLCSMGQEISPLPEALSLVDQVLLRIFTEFLAEAYSNPCPRATFSVQLFAPNLVQKVAPKICPSLHFFLGTAKPGPEKQHQNMARFLDPEPSGPTNPFWRNHQKQTPECPVALDSHTYLEFK